MKTIRARTSPTVTSGFTQPESCRNIAWRSAITTTGVGLRRSSAVWPRSISPVTSSISRPSPARTPLRPTSRRSAAFCRMLYRYLGSSTARLWIWSATIQPIPARAENVITTTSSTAIARGRPRRWRAETPGVSTKATRLAIARGMRTSRAQ